MNALDRIVRSFTHTLYKSDFILIVETVRSGKRRWIDRRAR